MRMAQSSLQLPSYIDLLKSLIRHPAVVGAEHSFFRVLQRELEERGAKVTWYEGLLVAEGNDPKSLFVSAHMDRHGLICTGPNEFQYAAFVAGARSDLLGNSVSEEMMLTIADRFAGADVYAYEPWSGSYRGSGKVRNCYICNYRNNLIFEVEGLEYVVAGMPVAFRDDLTVTDETLAAQLDNVLTVALLIDMFSHGFQGTAFFTAQEEAGKSWRYLLEWFRRFGNSTNHLLVVDTSPYPDTEAARAQDVVLRMKDANASFNTKLARECEKLCQSLNIRYSFKDAFIEQCNDALPEGVEKRSLGSTELGRIIAASNRMVEATTIQIPTTGYHTMEETASIHSCGEFQRLLYGLAGI
ncbi:MAG: hypothetical protein ACRBBN_00025 [Methyloligellaceae bacterium]